MKLDRMTWPEVADYLTRDRRLIIPAGTCEQHGKHLPLNTDSLVAEYVADYLSGETGVPVAPTINYGVNLPCDSCFAGTTGVAEDDLRKTLVSLVDGWEGQGFEQFYVVSAHGDPFHLKALGETGRQSIRLLDLYDLNLEDMLDGQAGCGHACEAETSVMMHLFPGAVRAGLVEDFETPFEEFKAYLFHQRSDPVPGSPGCQGYPSMASAAKGAEVVARIKARALRWMTEDIRL